MVQEIKEAPSVTIRLVNTTPSAWVLEGSNRDGQAPIRMAFPSLYRIVPNSKVKEVLPEGGYRLVPIRHINSCDTIVPSEQDEMGLKPSAEEDNIWLVNGTLTVVREGSTIGTYDYITSYQGNSHNSNRPPNADIEFEEVRSEEIAATENVSFDVVQEAITILSSIRKKNGGGKIEYDNNRLGVICRLMDIVEPTPEERFKVLSQIALREPELLVSSIANSDKLLIADLKQAQTLSVLFFKEDMAYLSDNTVVLHFRNGPSKQPEQFEKVVEYMKTEEGNYIYKQIMILVGDTQAKQLSSNPI